MEGILVAGGLGGVLLAVWLAANRREVRRADARDADWAEDGQAPRLWTSGARCPACQAAGGVLSAVDEGLWFTCLACGQRHRRETKA